MGVGSFRLSFYRVELCVIPFAFSSVLLCRITGHREQRAKGFAFHSLWLRNTLSCLKVRK